MALRYTTLTAAAMKSKQLAACQRDSITHEANVKNWRDYNTAVRAKM